MHTLAVRQPWATHIAEGTKTIEVRSWRTHYRGPLLIAASGKPLQIRNDGGRVETLPTQCLVCIVDLLDCRPWLRSEADAACLADWDTGFWGWHLTNPRHVRAVPHKGKLSIYQTPEGCELLPDQLHYLDSFTAGQAAFKSQEKIMFYKYTAAINGNRVEVSKYGDVYHLVAQYRTANINGKQCHVTQEEWENRPFNPTNDTREALWALSKCGIEIGNDNEDEDE